MKNIRKIRIAAWLLTLVMLLQGIPLEIFASGITELETVSVSEDLQIPESDLLENAVIVGEDVSRRSEFEKHYILSDNTRLAVTYALPVHRLNEDTWEEVDYSLEYESADLSMTNDFNGYINNIGSGIVKFAENSASDKLFCITGEGYSVSADMIGGIPSINSGNIILTAESTELNIESVSNNVVATVQSIEQDILEYDEKTDVQEFNVSVIQKAISGDSVKYSNMIDGVDLEYSVTGNGIKENIVVKKRLSNYSFNFLMNLDGLDPVVEEDGSIILYSSETSKAELTIPTPFMYDADMNCSSEVEYSITNVKGNQWILTVDADDEWASSATLPLIIDPAIIKTTDSVLEIVNTKPSGNITNTLDMYIGHHDNNSITKSSVLVKWDSVESLRPADVMIDAGLYMLFMSGVSNLPDVKVSQITEEWTNSTISATNLPSTSSTIVDYLTPWTYSDYRKIDITNLMQDYYNTGSTNGILMTAENSSFHQYVVAMGNMFVNPPYIAVRYMNQSGLESDWSFTETDAGFAGTSYVNVFNGNLVHVREDIKSSSPIMPLSISHIYNGSYSDLNFSADRAYLNTCCYTGMSIGSGWKLSIQESIVPAPMTELPLEQQCKYIYNDSDGTDHYIYLDGDQYVDDEGLGLTLTVSDTEYVLTDSSGYKKVFKIISETVKNTSYMNGYLVYEEDENGNRITYTYDENIPTRVVSVSDPSGTTVQLNYNSDGYLSSLVSGDRIITYSYSASYMSPTNVIYDFLTSVVDSYGGTATYTYGNLNEFCGKTMMSATDYTGKTVEYSYIHPNTLQYKVSSVETRIGTSYVNGIGYSYSDRKSSTVLYYGNDGVKDTDDDIYITYVFDRNGNNTLIYTENKDRDIVYSTEMYGYSSENGTQLGGSDYKLLNTASTGVVGRNVLTGGNAEGETCDLVDNNTILSIVDTESYEGSHSYKIMTTAASTKAFMTASLVGGKEYTFSAYVKSGNIPSGNIFIQAYSPTGTMLGETILDVTNTNTNINNGWERIFIDFVAESTNVHTLYIGVTNSSGCVVYADALKLEETLPYSPTAYNLIMNSGFENGLTNWTVSHSAKTSLVRSAKFGSRAVSVSGDPRENITITQNINISESPKTSYIISGWAKANSLNTDEEDRTFGLYAKVYYGILDGEETVVATPLETVIPFTWESSDWQYVSGVVELPYDENVVEITSIDVGVQYKNNANRVIFDDIALIEGSATEYEYDTNGNITEVVVDGESEYSYVYDANDNLTTVLESDGSIFMSCTYDNDGNIMTVADGEGTVIYSYTYDEYGNIATSTDTEAASSSAYSYNSFGQSTGSATSKTIDGTLLTISSSQTYDPVTKLPLSETDSIGNTVNYSYNGKMLLTMIEDALDVQTRYMYNDNSTLSKVYLDKDKDNVYDTSETGLTYTYDTYGRITGITTKNSTYTITYNDANLVSSISIGNVILCSYNYNSAYTELVSVNLGDGANIYYTYDVLGNISKVKYGNAVMISYAYDWNGNVVYENDNESGIISKYFYDNSGNWCGTRVHGDDYVLYTYCDDETENVYSSIYDINGTVIEYQSVYDEETDTTKFVLPTEDYIISDDDAFGRIVTQALKSSAGGNLIEYEYDYHTVDGNTTNLVSGITAYVGSGTIDMDYTYDAVGNITKEYRDNVLVKEYTYDELGQLTKEINHSTGEIVFYYYDGSGNISAKLLDPADSNAMTPISYSYSNTWKDQLASYNGTSITYTDNGYPLNWPEIGAVTWDKTNLKTAGEWTMNYTASGIRTDKVKETGSYIYRTYFVLDGDRVIAMRETSYSKMIGANTVDSTIYFMYDDSGNPIGMRAGSRVFYYVKNLQGDIIAITDATGTIVAEYTYDAWGKILSITGSNTSIANDNPFRYRGYFWDDDLGLYYLQSRYYDPDVCRFISPDNASLLPELIGDSLIGGNLYAYCGNNSINRIDPDGRVWYSNTITYNRSQRIYNVKTVIGSWFTDLIYNYVITSWGVIRFSFESNTYWSVLWRGWSKTLAQAMYNAAKYISNSFLKGRTIGGLDIELKLHYAAFKLGIKKSSSKQADMGSTYKSSNAGYDSNAWFFEGANAARIVAKINFNNLWGAVSLIKDISRYL